MRLPIAAGSFYEGNKEKLIEQIKACFLSKFGPGKLPECNRLQTINAKKAQKTVVSLIVPHAGYVCSGMCAASAYVELCKYRPDTIIILGTDHTGNCSGLSLDDWQTLLGTVEVDKEFCKSLLKKNDCNIKINEESHINEHSIEVQLPFLQYIYAINAKTNEKGKKMFKIVPITLSDDLDFKKVACSIYETMRRIKKSYAIIASGDFTHYGANYGYVPFTDGIKENIEKLDKKAINLILDLDSKGFCEFISKTKATICGRCGFTVLIELNKMLGLKGKLLKYYTSGDVLGDYHSSVSYAALLFQKTQK